MFARTLAFPRYLAAGALIFFCPFAFAQEATEPNDETEKPVMHGSLEVTADVIPIPTLVIVGRVVELRDAVIKAAYRFFQFPRSKRMTVLTMDASDYLDDESQPQTDILFSDMYGAEGLDLQQTQPWFLERCYESLKADGWLVLNCWNQHRGETEMLETLCELFDDVRVCTTQEGNWVVFAGKRASQISASQLKTDAKKLSKKLGYALTANLSRLNHYRGPR